MTKCYKKTTTCTSKHQKIRKDLCSFTAKHLGTTLPHMRKLKKNTSFNDSTLVSFASGKVNIIQETKVFLVAKHNSPMITDSTNTFAIHLGNSKNCIYVITNRNNPLYRNMLPEKNKIQTRKYSTQNIKQTWADSIYPYFTSEYYYAGQIVTTVAVVLTVTVAYYYIAPAIAGYHNMPAQTNNGIDTIKPSMENTTAETKTNNDINTIEPLIETTNVQKSDELEQLANNGYNRLFEVCEESVEKIQNLKKIDKLKTYINEINNGKYDKDIHNFFKEYDKEKVEANEMQIPIVIKDITIIEALEEKKPTVINVEIAEPIIEELQQLDEQEQLTLALEIIFEFLKICYID